MITRNKKEVTDIIHGAVPLAEVRRGRVLVWQREQQASSSCFGSGYWINDLPWLNDDAWKN